MCACTDQQGAAATHTCFIMNNQWLVGAPKSLRQLGLHPAHHLTVCEAECKNTQSFHESHLTPALSEIRLASSLPPPAHPPTPNHTLFWAVIKPHTSISGRVWAMWDMIIQSQPCGRRHEKRKQEKTERERGKAQPFS